GKSVSRRKFTIACGGLWSSRIVKAPCPRLRTNLPRWSVAMNRTLTSSTRFLMVRTGSDGSELDVAEAVGNMLEVATKGDCACSPVVATTTAITHRHHFV